MTADGNVYTWGGGSHGASGHNDEEDKQVPTKIDSDVFQGSRVVVVSARAVHSVSICEHNRQRIKCKVCGGSGICHHNREKSTCNDCRRASICEHNRITRM